jgi:hypothetical protein
VTPARGRRVRQSASRGQAREECKSRGGQRWYARVRARALRRLLRVNAGRRLCSRRRGCGLQRVAALAAGAAACMAALVGHPQQHALWRCLRAPRHAYMVRG